MNIVTAIIAMHIAFATVPQTFSGNASNHSVLERQNQSQQQIVQKIRPGTSIFSSLVRVLNQQSKIYRLHHRLQADHKKYAAKQLKLRNNSNHADFTANNKPRRGSVFTILR